jgi:hypothetical protein
MSSLITEEPLSSLQSHSSHQDQQPRLVCTWSAHALRFGPSKSFPRRYYTLSATATAPGELFLFGGYRGMYNDSDKSGDLYVISTRDFSTTLLQTTGNVTCSLARGRHGAALTSTNLLIWGGTAGCWSLDNSLRLLNFGTSNLLMSGPTPADQSVLCSSISRVVPHQDQWPQTARSLRPYCDNGRFQVLCLWWSDRRESCQ